MACGQELYLPYYALQTSKPSRVGHGVLVLPPLIITVAFCYGFVLMQPHATKHQTTAASQPVGLTHIDDGLPSLSIAPPSSLPSLTTIAQDLPAGSTPADIVTGTPQPSTDGVNALQGAVSSDGQTIAVSSAGTHHFKNASTTTKTASPASTSSPTFLHSLLHKL